MTSNPRDLGYIPSRTVSTPDLSNSTTIPEIFADGCSRENGAAKGLSSSYYRRGSRRPNSIMCETIQEVQRPNKPPPPRPAPPTLRKAPSPPLSPESPPPSPSVAQRVYSVIDSLSRRSSHDVSGVPLTSKEPPAAKGIKVLPSSFGFGKRLKESLGIASSVSVPNFQPDEKPKSSRFWCLECRSPAREYCEGAHAVLALQAALRRRLQLQRGRLQLDGLAEEARGALQQDKPGDEQDEQQALLDGLELLGTGRAAVCDVRVRQDGGSIYNARLRLEVGELGEEEVREDWNLEDKLVHTLVLLLVKKGRLRRRPLQEEARTPVATEAKPTVMVKPARSTIAALRKEKTDEALRVLNIEVREKVMKRAQEAADEDEGHVQLRAGGGEGTQVEREQKGDATAPRASVELHALSRSWTSVESREALVEKILRDQVVRLSMLWCDGDADWSAELLRKVGPQLEELQALRVGAVHVAALRSMPRLRRLHICGVEGGELSGNEEDRPPAVVPAPRSNIPSREDAGLEWLLLGPLPRATALSLMRAHGATLRHVQLTVGTSSGASADAGGWPTTCGDLDEALRSCRLRSLVSLLLLRAGCHHQSGDSCRDQLAELRAVLPPEATLACEVCDDALREVF